MSTVDADIVHAFVSLKSDGPDPTLVKPSDWDAKLKVTSGTVGQRMIRNPAATNGVSLVDFSPITLTNRSGSTTAIGDVLAISTADDTSTVIDDVATSLRRYVIAQDIITDGSLGLFAASGVAVAKCSGSVVRGRYVLKGAAIAGSKLVTDSGVLATASAVPPLGTIGVALAAASGGLVLIELYPVTLVSPPILAGYLKGTGTTYATQATPIPAADLGASPDGTKILYGDNSWRVAPTPVLNRITADTTFSNSTAENTLYTFSIPGGTLGTTIKLRLTIYFQMRSDDANQAAILTLRFKYGATTLYAGTHNFGSGSVGINAGTGSLVFEVMGDGATNAQIGGVLVGTGYLASGSRVMIQGLTPTVSNVGLATEDSTAAKSVTLTAQMDIAHANVSVKLMSALLEVL